MRNCPNPVTRQPRLDDLTQLVLKAQQDKSALNELMRQLFTLLVVCCGRILRNVADAEDCAQNVLLKIWLNLARFNPIRGSALHWVKTIALHESISFLRARRKMLVPLGDRDPVDERPAVILGAEIDERLAELNQALSRLPAEQRSVLRLRFLEEQSWRAAAAAENIPLNTAVSRARRGIEFLQSHLRKAA